MKIGVITNLVDIDGFVQHRLSSANAAELMVATGGNTGNVAFVQGVLNIVGGIKNIVHWGDDPTKVHEYFDKLVVCCANQLGSHVDLGGWAERLEKFNLPTIFIGLGAQSDKIGDVPNLPEGTVRFLKVAEKLRHKPDSTNIITRGEFSSSVIEHYGSSSSPFGCPSLFISSEKKLGERCFANQMKSKFPRILAAAGNPWHQSCVLEKTLIEIVNKYNGEYILQHPEAIFNLAMHRTDLLNTAQTERFSDIYSFIGDIKDIADWFSSYSVYFADAQNWIHYSKRFSLALGPRYHGVALPIQAGVPGKVIAIDSRTEELALTTGIPVIKYQEVGHFSPSELVQACLWTEAEASTFDAVRENNAIKYSGFLKENGILTSLSFNELLG